MFEGFRLDEAQSISTFDVSSFQFPLIVGFCLRFGNIIYFTISIAFPASHSKSHGHVPSIRLSHYPMSSAPS